MLGAVAVEVANNGVDFTVGSGVLFQYTPGVSVSSLSSPHPRYHHYHPPHRPRQPP